MSFMQAMVKYKYKVECAVWFTMAESYNQIGILPPTYKKGNF